MKDGVNARLDMVDMRIRPELHPLVRRNGKLYCPPACYTLSKAEKTEFCTFLHGVKVQAGLHEGPKTNRHEVPRLSCYDDIDPPNCNKEYSTP